MPTTLTEALCEARMHVVQAETRLGAGETSDALDHLRAAEARLDIALVECPVCGRRGLPQRVLQHGCF